MTGCRACAAALPPGARFCPSCGSPVQSPAAGGGERRVVTVVFADLVNFTALAENLDPEAVRNLLDRCFSGLARVVDAHGGVVDKVVGDEIMAVFGAPTVHEDDAERAVRAALGLHAALADVDPALVLRVGINTGEVLAGPVGPGGGYTVTGDAVNTAHRLVTVAKPGEVLVGERTWLATRGAMEYEPRPSFRVRGKRDEVRAHAALGALGLPGMRPWQSRTSPLVGREKELALLRDAARQAFGGSVPRLVTITGEAGMGKTRLVLELQAELWETLPAGLFLWSRCPSYGASPVWPLAQVLRDAFGIDPGDQRDEAREKLDAGLEGIEAATGTLLADGVRRHIAELLGIPVAVRARADGDVGVRPSTPDDLQRSAAQVLEGLAASQPTVIVLDDLHWAQSPLLDAIRRFVDQAGPIPLLMVAIGRNEVTDGRAAMDRLRDDDLVTLGPLSDHEAETVLVHLLGAPPHPSAREPVAAPQVDDPSRRRILGAAGGNPFFLEELANYLLDTGTLRRQDGTWALSEDLSGESLPDSVRAVLGARLDTLPTSEHRFLQEAAVAGERFASEAMAELGAWGAQELEEVVRALVQRGILERRPGDEVGDLAFRHVLTRDVVYASVPLGARASAHVEVAAWLERRFGADLSGEALDRVARHYEQAVALGRQLDDRDPLVADRAWLALVRIARQAMAQQALRDADRLFRRAADLAGPVSSPETIDVLLDHGATLAGLWRLDAARRVLTAARHAAEEAGLEGRVAAATARLAALPDASPPGRSTG